MTETSRSTASITTSEMAVPLQGSFGLHRGWLRLLLELLLLGAALLSPLIGRAADITTVYVGANLRLNGTEIYADLETSWPRASSQIPASVTSTPPGLSLSNDLHQRVQNGQLSPAEALQMESELMMRHGSVYYLPMSQEELKDSIGFPKDTVLAANDLRDLIPVHVQMALGISPMTAAYLIEKLQLQIVVSPDEASALEAHAVASAAQPAPLAESARTSSTSAPDSSPTSSPSLSSSSSPGSALSSMSSIAPSVGAAPSAPAPSSDPTVTPSRN